MLVRILMNTERNWFYHVHVVYYPIQIQLKHKSMDSYFLLLFIYKTKARNKDPDFFE